MRYHLDTIPVWDSVKQQGVCPFCFLYRKREDAHITRFLGGSVMEPDVRIIVNRDGFCREHHRMLYAQQNRLGHALMMESHLEEQRKAARTVLENTLRSLQADTGMLSRLKKNPGPAEGARQLLDACGRCAVCDALQEDMEHYARTAVILFEKDAEFREALRNAPLCLPHTALLMQSASEHLKGKALTDLIGMLLDSLNEHSAQAQEELHTFTLKFDYRNTLPPSAGRGALEGAVNMTRSWCLGDDPLASGRSGGAHEK